MENFVEKMLVLNCLEKVVLKVRLVKIE